jgi:RNA polymerase sigma-70 factor (ECF subfamily)
MSPTTQPDEVLVSRVAKGDTFAFAELYDRHGRRAYLQARALCATAEQAEDVTQEAFLSLWRLARGFDPGRGGFAAWMSAIVRNRVTDTWRRAAARPAEVGFPEEASQVLGATEDGVRRALERTVLRELLADLPREQRDAIFLAYFEDLTAEQIASRVGVPLGTAKSRTRLGLAKLRREIAPVHG